MKKVIRSILILIGISYLDAYFVGHWNASSWWVDITFLWLLIATVINLLASVYIVDKYLTTTYPEIFGKKPMRLFNEERETQ